MEQKYIIDLESESQKAMSGVLIETRPFTFGSLYSHIERTFADIHTHLEGNGCLVLSVFGSDDLHNWECVMNSLKMNEEVDHVRMNRAASSFRYYKLVLCGSVPYDTDISRVLIDYYPVRRRL